MYKEEKVDSAKPRTSRRKFAGYSLIEMGIALAVGGLLFSGFLVPIHKLHQERHVAQTEQLLERARVAVINYAIASRTTGAVYVSEANVTTSIFPGRAKLPCPDINNDGYEDLLLDAAYVANPYYVVDDPADVDMINGIMTNSQLALGVAGICKAAKGLLPWKTLHLISGNDKFGDVWGTQFTYYVDPALTSPLLGFDRRLRVDNLHYVARYDDYEHIPGENRPVYFERGVPFTVTLRDNMSITTVATELALPPIICLDTPCDLSDLDNVSVEANALAQLRNLASGVVASVIIDNTTTARKYDVNDLVNAPAFVILSHGKNGYGGVRVDGECFLASPQNKHEIENAYYGLVGDDKHILVTNLSSIPDCNDPPDSGLVGLRENVFINRVLSVSEDRKSDYDDLIIWESPDSLVAELAIRGSVDDDYLSFFLE